MQENSIFLASSLHKLTINLVGFKQINAFFEFVFFAHGNPDVGINGVGISDSFVRIFHDFDGGAGLVFFNQNIAFIDE